MDEQRGDSVLCVVPARLGSTRFPEKMLVPLCGKPLVLHAYERAGRATRVSDILIATDDERIARAVEPFGARYEMTRPDHASGTDRIAEVAARHPEAAIIVNVQGDEALIDPDVVDAVIQALMEDAEAAIATAACPIQEADRLDDPNVVKVVCDIQGRALYFSRARIPHVRDAADTDKAQYLQHLGLYAYRRERLMAFAGLPQTPLEKLEKLEQLRALENGWKIRVIETDYTGIGVDVPADLERVRKMLEQGQGG